MTSGRIRAAHCSHRCPPRLGRRARGPGRVALGRKPAGFRLPNRTQSRRTPPRLGRRARGPGRVALGRKPAGFRLPNRTQSRRTPSRLGRRARGPGRVALGRKPAGFRLPNKPTLGVMDVAIMVEGQSGLTWPRWQRIVRATEKLGFAGLYRSDHLVSAQPPNQDALELWTSLTWLASNTDRIEFGPLVSPLTFRHPVHLAQAARALDDLSNGRFTLGLGAGWSQREHDMYGFPLLAPNDRLDRLEEGLRIITGLLRSGEPVSYQGQHFTVHEAVLLPRPARATPVLVAGRGRKRS